MRTEVLLPFGIVDPEGRQLRRATLTPITGQGELLGADDPNPFRAALVLLAASLIELGPYRGTEIDTAVLGELLPVDRDYLLVHLNRLTFGDVRYHTVECPQANCRRRVDVQFALSDVESPAVSRGTSGMIELVGGDRIRFRLPTAADQAALHDIAPAALEAAFLERCVTDDRDANGRLAVLDMPAAVRAELEKHIVAACPALDLAVPLECPQCGRLFRFVFDPVLSLVAELAASRGELLRQVHRLALSYHWSHSEILGLSRPLRLEYLHLLQDEVRP